MSSARKSKVRPFTEAEASELEPVIRSRIESIEDEIQQLPKGDARSRDYLRFQLAALTSAHAKVCKRLGELVPERELEELDQAVEKLAGGAP